MALELLWFVYLWLPLAFLLDVALFHVVADDPLALRWRLPVSGRSGRGTATARSTAAPRRWLSR